MAFLNIVFIYGMETAWFRFASVETLNATSLHARSQQYNVTLTSILLTSLLFSGLIIIFSSPIAHVLDYPDKQSFIIWLALILAIDAVVTIPFAKLRLEKKATQFATARLINIVLNIGLNLFFLVFCKDVYDGNYLPALKPVILKIYSPEIGVGYVFLSNLIANAMLIIILWRSFFSFRIQLNWQKLKPMLVYAWPLLFMGLAGMVNEMIDRILLKQVLPEGFYPGKDNLAALGIYGACYKLSIFMTLGIQAFRYAAEPFFFSEAKNKNAPELFANVMNWFVIACCIIFLIISVNLDLFLLLLRQAEYREGGLVIPVLLLANLFLGIYYNLSIWYKLKDKTHYGMYISIGGAVITIFLNLALIPFWGYMGCAVATLICYFLMAVACYFYGKKYFPIPYDLKSGFGYILGAVLLVIIALSGVLGITNYMVDFLFHNFLILVYLVIIWFIVRPKFFEKKG